MIVLGVDGMDPGFVARHWSSLPNLSRLRLKGDFKPLGTTTPPQSPVAWSTFITGTDPEEHGIYDFVHRDPATYVPHSSMSKIAEPRYSLSIGPYLLPFSGGRVISLRRGTAFWESLARSHIPVTILRMPTNYPPVTAGKAIAGMGTPDLRGTTGTFSFYTDDVNEIPRSVTGGDIKRIPRFKGRTVLILEGPPNPLRRDHLSSTVELTVDVDPEKPVARVAIGDSITIVQQGEWSGWLRVKFPLISGLASARGMLRVYAKELHPQFLLYVSPINIDPEEPDLPVFTPASYGREIARATSPFYTLGFAEESAALRNGVFSLPEYVAQSRLVLEDEHKLLRYALREFRDGLLFAYFSAIDQDSHMLWGKHEAELLDTYRAMDAIIGEVLDKADGAEVIVMSDHGFTSFDRAVNLNAWLSKNGYLALETGLGDGSASLPRVDWSRTRAYAVGLNSVYLNLAGREEQGIVAPGAESQAVLRKLQEELLALRDGSNVVIKTVYTPARSDGAPDLIVGYAPRYRVSWHSELVLDELEVQRTGIVAFGFAPGPILEDNKDPWIGDHCINAADVPGVLFSQRKIQVDNPELKDFGISILQAFGVSPGPGISGRNVLQR
jgi:predicted AlkP superfamily phosphohydrolase/phosphomutase